MLSEAVIIYPLWKPISLIAEPANNLTLGTPLPGVHH